MSTRQAVDDDIGRIGALLNREIGLQLDTSLQSRVQRCVRDGAAVRGLSIADYVDDVMLLGVAFQSLLDAITVQETGFFRHAEQFDVLARDLLPHLRPPVKIWSAGCANGQEAYSLAMVLDEQGVAGSVIATDLAETALERTSAGLYAAREIRGLSRARVERYLSPLGQQWEINTALRGRVSTLHHNLVDPLPSEAIGCQVIFCRNILIYLSQPHVRTFIARLADAFPPGVPLFIGAAEVLWQVSDAFEPVRIDGTFFYRRRGAAAPPPRSAPVAGAAVIHAVPRPRRDPVAAAPSRSPVPVAAPGAVVAAGPASALDLARTGQEATARGDHQSAVVAFRACAYLSPYDAIAHLHLGLALEATGDRAAANRAFGVARTTLMASDPVLIEQATEGYTRDELLSLLDSKRRSAPL